MANKLDVNAWKDELLAAYRFGEEERARALVRQPGPRKARALLEAMLEEEDVLVRQAAVFGLGELGGAASVQRLEQQLVREEARVGHDGDSVAEAITASLGRLEDAGARSILLRRMHRMLGPPLDPADTCTLARALWLRRHPELLPPIRQALEQLPPGAPTALHGLSVLLEKSPEALSEWARDMSVPLNLKSEVLAVLTEEIPDALISTLPSFISTGHASLDMLENEEGAVSAYCLELLSLLLRHREHIPPRLPPEARSELRAMARTLVAARTLINCATRAAVLLRYVGLPEDADLLMTHRPTNATFAAVFDESIQALRGRK